MSKELTFPTDTDKVRSIILKKDQETTRWGTFTISSIARQIGHDRIYVSSVINNNYDRLPNNVSFNDVQAKIAEALGLDVKDIQEVR